MDTAPLPYYPLEDTRSIVAAIQPIKFWIKYVPQSDGSNKAYEMVEWAKKGVNIPATVVERVDKIISAAKRPNLEPDDEYAAKWRAIEAAYRNWKESGNAEIINGTPLSTWAGITADVVEFLKPMRIYSVEDLAQASDTVLAKIPDPNAQRYRDRARKFLETKDIALAVRQLDERDSQIEELKKMVELLNKKQADADLGRRDAERDLEEVAPVGRKRKA